MKNIEQILADVGIKLTDEQKTTINQGVSENYKTVADYNKQVKKLENAETERDNYKSQFDDAQATIKKFDGVDVEKLNKDIADWKQRAQDAEKEVTRKLLKRDQADYLKQKLGAEGYDVKSPRALQSLIDDIMDDEKGLKWHDGQFLGLDDYMKAEKEKDPTLYLSQEEKDTVNAQNKAASSAPKFTGKTEGKSEPPKETKPVPKIW